MLSTECTNVTDGRTDTARRHRPRDNNVIETVYLADDSCIILQQTQHDTKPVMIYDRCGAIIRGVDRSRYTCRELNASAEWAWQHNDVDDSLDSPLCDNEHAAYVIDDDDPCRSTGRAVHVGRRLCSVPRLVHRCLLSFIRMLFWHKAI